MLILCKAWALRRRLFRMGWGRLLFPYELLGFPFLFLKNRVFLFFYKRKAKKGHANFSSVFLEGNGRHVGLDPFFFFSFSASIHYIPPTPHSDMSSRSQRTSDSLQLWLRSERNCFFFFTTLRGRVLTVSANDERESTVEEDIDVAFDCFVFFSARISKSVCFVWKLSCFKERRSKSHWGFPAFWTDVLSFKCKHTYMRRVPHQHTLNDLYGQHSLFKHCLKV